MPLSSPNSRTSKAMQRSFFAAAALLITLCLFFSWTTWQGAKTQEALYLSVTAELSGKSLDSYIQHYENALHVISTDLANNRNVPNLLSDFRRANPDLINVYLIRPDGQILFSSDPSYSGLLPTLSDSPSFILARDELQQGQTFNIGRPTMGKVFREWQLPLRYAVRDDAGALVAIISATLPLARQQSFWQDLKLPENTALGLIRDDGYLVSRFPMPLKMNYEEAYGQPRNGALFDYLKQNGYPERGQTEGFNSVAKADYVFSFRRLPHYPLTLFVSTPISNIFAKWWRQMQFAYALLAIILMGGYATYRWALRRQRAWDREKALSDARFEFLAHHDPLTELPNRLLIKERLRLALAYAERSGTKVAVLFLDLDHFKTINDSLGHPVGDLLLKAVAERLGSCIRETDTLSRVGGDEFLIVLSEIRDADAVTAVCDKIFESLHQAFAVEDNQLNTSLSIGIAMSPDDGADFDTLLKKADTAMYKAKESGRNAYRFFTGQMNLDADEHLRVLHWLRDAIQEQHFVLHYQPQFHLGSGRLTGAEALVRLQHPSAGLIPPGRFIHIAEDSGLIVPLGNWVLREACRQAADWHRAGMHGLIMAVNLSAVQFRRSDILQSVDQALTESGLAPHCLELELTESILIDDTENVLATVQKLKARGIRFSIDDFGTGYSSLSYLKRFQVDKLKIDQSFVREGPGDANNDAIVRAVIQMAHNLGLTTIAEGVEDVSTLSFLHTHGCNEAQGYHFGRPVPAADFAARFAGTTATESLPLTAALAAEPQAR